MACPRMPGSLVGEEVVLTLTNKAPALCAQRCLLGLPREPALLHYQTQACYSTRSGRPSPGVRGWHGRPSTYTLGTQNILAATQVRSLLDCTWTASLMTWARGLQGKTHPAQASR